jgi:hypothetical protein
MRVFANAESRRKGQKVTRTVRFKDGIRHRCPPDQKASGNAKAIDATARNASPIKAAAINTSSI